MTSLSPRVPPNFFQRTYTAKIAIKLYLPTLLSQTLTTYAKFKEDFKNVYVIDFRLLVNRVR